MEKPSFPLPVGKYIVTGDREVTTELTIEEGNRWSLKEGAGSYALDTPNRCVRRLKNCYPGTLHDVTHLPCRSARYTPLSASETGGTPANVKAGACCTERISCGG
jgi:hypothetical protein